MKSINHSSGNKGVLFLALILIIVVTVSAFIAFSLRVDTVDESLKNDSVIKTLIVLEDKKQVLFSDVFIYYPVSKRGALINILGNTGAIFQSLGRVDRIDAIYTEKGIDVFKSEIENLIGQPIPFYLEMSLSDFSELTDMLGGLKVFVPSPVDVKNDDGERWLLPSGAVTLDGSKINTYLTYSKPEETEAEIVDRRQNVMLAFLSALNRDAEIMLNKKNFPFYEKKINSNLKEQDLHKLLSEISNVDYERLIPQSITGTRRMVDGKELLFPFYDGQLIKDVVNQASNALVNLEDMSVNRIYVLEIQNGTMVQGLARNTAALLKSAGYDVLSTLNAERQDIEKTQIINHIGNADIAKNLGDFIHCTNIVEEEIKPDGEDGYDNAYEASSNVDFTIILGKDFDGRYVKGQTVN
ncbi:MAG: LCP family protein [Spirochaetia bacterium]|uniref:LCP family protein n=1 Tax=Treponema berlinense TaxID=225004 RepID=UPI0026ED3840|nr:LCP family protein [Treponema berlinense]MDD5789337.1 LCP family protein [Spirochaetia bacterium]